MPELEWDQLKEVFHAAVALPPKERAAYLDKACAGDPLLRQSVESLLKSHEEFGFVDAPAFMAAANLLVDDQHRQEQTEMGAFQQGELIGRYRINSLLGEGGMGRVYLAEDTKLHRKVSLKFLSKAVTRDHEKLLRFEQEARAASALNQPNILTIYEFGEEAGHQFIATEYIEGQTLRQRLQPSIELDDALEIVIQIASALVAAHRVNIVHRDIKPDNIIIRKDDGLVKVLDFGLAKVLTPRTSTTKAANSEAPTRFKTGAGVVMGTVAYMSPEQARADTIDERTDIWSLGVVLYEMITGSIPFAAETSNEIISGILSRQPAPPLARFSHDAPERLQEIVDKALTKDRDERYQTSKDLLIDLKRLKQSLELKASLDRSSPPDTARAPSKSVETAIGHAAVPTAYPTSSAEYVVNQIKLHKSGVFAVVAILLVAVAGSVITGISLYRSRQAAVTSAPAVSSLAVLPFVNGNDPDSEFLSDGITDNIIDQLSQLPGLRVMSHTAVFRYKGRDADPRAIARELGVEAVLIGRLVRRGDTLTLNLELVNAKDNSHIWGEQYDRKMSDLLFVQREIPIDIAEKLRLRLSSESKERLVRRYTDNPEAYELYLKGVFYWNKRRPDGYKKAVELFNQSIEKDPNYALAYAGLAGCYAQGEYPLPPKEKMPLARQSALKAIELDDTLADPHSELGRVKQQYDWDWEGAEKEFTRAIELNPNSSLPHMRYAGFLTNLGKSEAAIAEGHKAVALDPVSPLVSWALEFDFYWARRYDEAIAQAHKTLELDPNFVRSYTTLGDSYMQKGMYEQAFDWYLKGANLAGRTAEVTAWKEAYATEGVSGYYRKRVELEIANSEHDLSRQSLITVAVFYARLGEKEKLLEWLQKAAEERPYGMVFLKIEPAFDNMRSDPRFVELMKRVGFTA